MANRLTKKQKDFAEEYVKTGNGRQSVMKTYDPTTINAAGAIATENLKKPNVQEYIQSLAQEAANNIREIANTSENDGVRLSANKDILDRGGYKAVEKSVTLTINAETSDPNAIALAKEYEEKLKSNL